MSDRGSLRDHVFTLRRDAIQRGEALFFSPVPLFLLFAHAMSDEAIFGCIAHAIDDGHGDPDDLDPEDERQTSRLEAAILGRADSTRIEEVLSIGYEGWPSGLQDTLCVAEIGEDALLVVHRSHDLPAFMAVALGSRDVLLEELRLNPQDLLTRLELEHNNILQVVIRHSVNLSVDDVIQVVQALTGRSIGEDLILRGDLLAGSRP